MNKNNCTLATPAPQPNLPDGRYVGEIMDVTIEPLPESGGDIIILYIDVFSGGARVRIKKKYCVNSKRAVNFLKGEMSRAEAEIENRDEFVQKSEMLKGQWMKLKAETNASGFQCWYILGKFVGGGGEAVRFEW